MKSLWDTWDPRIKKVYKHYFEVIDNEPTSEEL